MSENKIDLGPSAEIPADGDVTVSAAQLRELVAQVKSVDEMRTQIEELTERYEVVAPVAFAGIELARKDVTPEEARRNLEILIDADGGYTPEEKQKLLATMKDDNPSDGSDELNSDDLSGGTDDSTGSQSPKKGVNTMTEEERSAMEALKRKVDELEGRSDNVNRLASNANTQLLRNRMNDSISRAMSDEKFAGGVVRAKQKQYAGDAEKLQSFDNTVKSQIETATLNLMREEIRHGRQASEINVEALVAKAAEQTGGTLQTVIGEDPIGSLTETVSGQSTYEDLLEEYKDVEDVTGDDIRKAHTSEDINELADRQEQFGLKTLMSAADTIEKKTNGTDQV